MRNFISSRTWEDWVIYGIIGMMIIGAILFVVGFMFSFNYSMIGSDLDLGGFGSGKISINKLIGEDIGTYGSLLKDPSVSAIPGNLFGLMGALKSGTAAYGMCATAVSGAAILMFDALIVIAILIWGAIAEFIIPKIKAKKEAK